MRIAGLLSWLRGAQSTASLAAASACRQSQIDPLLLAKSLIHGRRHRGLCVGNGCAMDGSDRT
jgi:hypothetical protein